MSIGGVDHNLVSVFENVLLLCPVTLLEISQSRAINDRLVIFFAFIYDSASEYDALA